MRHRKHHSRLSRPTGHRNAVLRNLSQALIEHERIETTITNAKTLQPYIESVVTLGKKGEVHHRRLAFSKLGNKHAVHKMFEEIAPRFADRNGGYTRVIRTRRRAGDAADMAFIEFIESAPAAASSEETKAEA